MLPCLEDELSDDVLERFITVVYTQGQDELSADRDLQQAMEDAIEPCEALIDG